VCFSNSNALSQYFVFLFSFCSNCI
jgi:hypothetical protein